MSDNFDPSQFQGQGPDIIIPPPKSEVSSPSVTTSSAAAKNNAINEGLTELEIHSDSNAGATASSPDQSSEHDEIGFKGAGPEKVIPISGPHGNKEPVVPLTPPMPPELPEELAIRAARRSLLVLLVLIVVSWLRYRRSISYIYAPAPGKDLGNWCCNECSINHQDTSINMKSVCTHDYLA